LSSREQKKGGDRERAKKNGAQKFCLSSFIIKEQKENKKLNKTQQLTVLHKKKTHHLHHGAEYFLLEQRLVHEDIRADTSQRSRYVLLRVRFFFLFIFLSLSTEEDRRNHHRRI
jgi:hypothetical protein|tara:strand:- start:2987 stop:3328 length:342 start_codon:yes stop_codon:yes gene_type:complete